MGAISFAQIDMGEKKKHDLELGDNAQYEAYYDIVTGKYIVYKKIGSIQIGQPVYMTVDEYSKFILDKKIKDYYKEKSSSKDKLARGEKSDDVLGKLLSPIQIKSKLFEIIFGGSKIELIPSGYASIDLGILSQKIDNPQLLPQNRSNFTIDLQQRMKLSLLGKVGENLKMQVNYDTQAGFAFENRLNLSWKPGGTGGEDNIIKNIEFGNVNLPLSTSLIRGAQALFGVKTQLQFGRTNVTAVYSEQQSEARNISVKGDGLINNFKVNVADYEDNQHYFISQYFRNTFDNALSNYPQILSNISITRIEVWKIDRNNSELQNQRAILGLRDLGETLNPTVYPTNSINTLYNSVIGLNTIRDPNAAKNAIDKQLLTTYTGLDEIYSDGKHYSYAPHARLLNSSEYKFHPQLGKIDLAQRLEDNQMLAVAFEYTINGTTESYKVGEFANETNGVLVAKLLKANTSSNDTTSPLWNLMMKNIYSLGSSQVTNENFYLNVTYQDSEKGKITYLPDPAVSNFQFIKLFNWDRLNMQGDLANSGQGDGIFDFVQNITIDAELGKVMFTKVEPFGKFLQDNGVNTQYIFNDLYTKQKAAIENHVLYSKYKLEGRYKGSQGGGGIPLGALNVPRGSVKVTANGQQLLEGSDYVVDYLLGRVTILNETIKNSGAAINVSLENQSAFNQQKKRFIGLNIDHIFNEKLRLGLTAVNYQERPLTQKAQYGVEPVNNSIYGFNVQYNSEVPYLTKLTNYLVKTEQKSNLSFKLEGAYLVPGTNKATENQSYIDDFEEAASKISLKDPNSWQLSSSNETGTGLSKGFKRALASWYNIDPRFYGVGGSKPEGIDQNALSSNLVRRVKVNEIYSNKDIIVGEQIFMNTFDLTFYPEFKGPYNNDATLLNENDDVQKQLRWGGIMRGLNVTNLKQANIESIEFWMMDPYADTNDANFLGANPTLNIDLGNISEDINSDGHLLYENGLPTPEKANDINTTIWGVYPKIAPLVYTFDSEGNSRRIQDAGYDGITDTNISNISGTVESDIFTSNTQINPILGVNDPALDDYVYYSSNIWNGKPEESDIRQRYRYFRNPEGNSPSGSLEASTTVPDAEDIDKDYNSDTAENFNTYTLDLTKSKLKVGENYIVDEKQTDVVFENGQSSTTKWYLVRIPLNQPSTITGATDPSSNLNNARFIRMMMRGFKNTSTLRFASLDLVRTEWRIYPKNIHPLQTPNIEGSVDVNTNNVQLGSVDFESNANSQPQYVLPPGIVRTELQAQGGTQSQNEASMYMKLENLSVRNPENSARGVFKNMQLDMRRYKKLKIFVSAQDLDNVSNANYDPDMKYFIRFGNDLSENYYEYEISLKYTPKTATSVLDIWPTENTIDLDLSWFTSAKNQRDNANFSLLNRFEAFETGDLLNKKVTVKGRPSLGNITTIMMGARRVSSDPITNSRNLILWINELRLSGIDNTGGYAANAVLNMNLADFAQIDATGSYQSVGFGALNEGPSERSQDEMYEYNINTAVNLDKLLPKKWGVKLPFQYSTGERFINPKYNPLDNDIEFKDAPNKDKLKEIVRTYSQQKTIAFPAIRKDRTTSAKPRFYDVENLTFSFLYSDDYYRDIYTKYNYNQTLRTSLDYNYNFKSKYIEPFKKWKYVQDSMKISKYLQSVKEFNFNLVPTKISFRTDMMRTYNEFQIRDINGILSGTETEFSSVYSNNFIFGWNYNIGFNLTRNLKLDFSSATRTLVDDIGNNIPNQKLIWQDLTKVGRPINYSHTLQLNYKLPLQYIPYMDFISTEVGYNAKYDWTARSTVTNSIDQNTNLGNLAQNSRGLNVTSNVDFTRIYDRFKSYKKFDMKKLTRQRELDSINRIYEANTKLKKPKKLKAFKFKKKNQYKTSDYAWMILSSIKRGQMNYTKTEGTSLPGFLGEPNFFGNNNIDGNNAPTFGFLFGSQSDVRERAFNENWITRSTYLLEPYFQTSVENLTANLNIEPIKDLRIDLNFMRNYQTSISQSGYNTENGSFIGYRDGFENEMASFNTSIISLQTAFSSSDDIFNKIRENSYIISKRLAERQGAVPISNPNEYTTGYDLTNAEVLIPSFYSAITGQNANSTKFGFKKNFPMPNWKITYTGLKNIPWVNAKVSSIEISHAYNSTYTVNGVQSNLNYYNSRTNGGNLNDLNGNRYNYYSYNTVSMLESFSPLIGINTTLRNNLQVRAEYNRDRINVLSLNNSTLQEDFSNEFIVGVGYILKDVQLKLRYQNKITKVKSDLNLRLDLSIRDNETKLRRLIEDDVQITGGQNIFSLKFSADYNFSKNLNLKLFYDQQVSKYKISTAFPLSTTRAGISATFQFGN